LGLFLKAAGEAISGNARWSVKCFQLLRTISSFEIQYEFDEFEEVVSGGSLKTSHGTAKIYTFTNCCCF